jgi:hypothetical protein
MDEGVRVDYHTREKIITREVSGDNFYIVCVNHPNTFIQGQYVFYYTECLMIQVIMLLEGQLLKK